MVDIWSVVWVVKCPRGCRYHKTLMSSVHVNSAYSSIRLRSLLWPPSTSRDLLQFLRLAFAQNDLKSWDPMSPRLRSPSRSEAQCNGGLGAEARILGVQQVCTLSYLQWSEMNFHHLSESTRRIAPCNELGHPDGGLLRIRAGLHPQRCFPIRERRQSSTDGHEPWLESFLQE